MKLHEVADHGLPLVWELALKQREKGKRVSIDATVVWARVANKKDSVQHLTGEVMAINPRDKNVSIYANRSNYSIRIYPDDDERLTLVKDKVSDFYWVENVKHVAEAVNPDRPFIWDMVEKLLEKGHQVIYSAHLPASSSWQVGKVEMVRETTFVLKVIHSRGRSFPAYSFSPDDDENLTLQPSPSNNGTYIIVDNK